jgi:rfaE bifunctional protein kinase chain/domain
MWSIYGEQSGVAVRTLTKPYLKLQPMNQDRIKDILKKISDVNIAVYGDFCLDSYWLIDRQKSEISIETGLKTETVSRHYYSPGGAGNVVANLAALTPAGIKVIGVIGDDIFGRELHNQLQALGADTSSLFVQPDHFDTYSYLKRIVDGREEPRIDFGNFNERSQATDQKILDALEAALNDCDALIFNQQVTGSINNEFFILAVNRLFEKYKDKIIMLDSRHFNHRFQNTCLKANDHEIASLSGINSSPDKTIPLRDVIKYGHQVFEKNKKPVFVTCGERGIIAFDGHGTYEIPGLQLKGPLDTVGAGDTTISALTLCLAAGVPAPEAAACANFAAAVTVQKLFTTGTANAEEIIRISQEPNFIFQPDLAANERLAIYLPETEFELCDPEITNRLGKLRYALFDHDGTLSTLRQGWEEIMETMMTEAILGDQFQIASQGIYDEVQEKVKNFIHKTTGIQTIFQMEGLAEMVREYGFVAENQVLDKFRYKDIYNERLMETVNKRVQKIR